MIRLFAPPTPNPALPRTGVTLGNLLLHVALVLGMMVPLEQEVRRALLDREVIYLVPLAKSAGPELSRGDLPWESAAAAATAAAVTRQDRATEAPTRSSPYPISSLPSSPAGSCGKPRSASSKWTAQ